MYKTHIAECHHNKTSLSVMFFFGRSLYANVDILQLHSHHSAYT